MFTSKAVPAAVSAHSVVQKISHLQYIRKLFRCGDAAARHFAFSGKCRFTVGGASLWFRLKHFRYLCAALFFPGLALTFGCLSSGTKSQLPPDVAKQQGVVSLEPQNWYMLYSNDVGPHPSTDPEGAWSFKFPQWNEKTGKLGHVNYVLTPFAATKKPSLVTIVFKVEDVKPQYLVFGDKLPATFRLFFERKKDDMENPDGRWWSGIVDDLGGAADGQVQVFSVPLTPENWGNVNGMNGGNDITGFNSALANVGYFGFTFGGQSFAGHGVALKSGNAKFVLIDYSVQ